MGGLMGAFTNFTKISPYGGIRILMQGLYSFTVGGLSTPDNLMVLDLYVNGRYLISIHAYDKTSNPSGSRTVVAEYKKEKPVLAKLTDFGLSLLKSETETTSSNMDAVRNVGTPRYSAPEVLRGEMLDVQAMMKTDVYSLGLTLLELLLGEIPFENLNVGQSKRVWTRL
ncbi:putative leucine-rich repeat receptor-like protein kinase imk3 [Bulinus truncatus]|nr:putative leucine-rich repeat receptor-like protein kinase imk3 [Bulinus truncatus]